MKMTEKNLNTLEFEPHEPPTLAPIYEQKSRRLSGKAGLQVDSLLAVFEDRLTYTFIDQETVASIHFDRKRQEIFYRGHNIRNMQLSPEQKHVLMEIMPKVLKSDERSMAYLGDYQATLAKVLTDKK